MLLLSFEYFEYIIPCCPSLQVFSRLPLIVLQWYLTSCFSLAFFFYYLFILLLLLLLFFFFGYAGSSLLCMLFSSYSEMGLLSSCHVQASRCAGFSCCQAQALENVGFSSCGNWTEQLQVLGSKAQARGTGLVAPWNVGFSWIKN